MNKIGPEIVLVEDNPCELELMLHALQRNNYKENIFVARDGEEAIAYFFEKENGELVARDVAPKLVLLDLKLPKIDGLEVLRCIKKNQRTNNIPVVILTSSQQQKDLVEAYSLGANSYIVKPVEFVEFMNVLNTILILWLGLNQLPAA